MGLSRSVCRTTVYLLHLGRNRSFALPESALSPAGTQETTLTGGTRGEPTAPSPPAGLQHQRILKGRKKWETMMAPARERGLARPAATRGRPEVPGPAAGG